jgi:O-antigen/teichoic acid export membrane protein
MSAEQIVVSTVADPNVNNAGVRQRFISDVSVFAGANLFYLLVTAVLTFLLPRFMSVEGYGYYRLFVLYAGFVGLLHFGYLDGILIRWASEPDKLPQTEFRGALLYLLISQAAVAVVSIFLARFILDDSIRGLALAICLYAFVCNLTTFGQYALQALKRFRVLSLATIAQPLLLLIFAFGLLASERFSWMAMVGAFVLANFLPGAAILVALGREFTHEGARPRLAPEIVTNLHEGFFVLVANLLTGVAFAIDRIFIGSRLSIEDFALYSLAANAMAIVLTMIQALARVVFPYLADGVSQQQRKQAFSFGHEIIFFVWSTSLLSYFVLEPLIRMLLPGYAGSIPILRWLMLPSGMTAIILVLHSNFFRIHRLQSRLLAGVMIGLTVLIGAIIFATMAGLGMEGIAQAMCLGIAGWWLADELLLRGVTAFTIGRIMAVLAMTVFAAVVFIYASQFGSYGWLLYGAVGLGGSSYWSRSAITKVWKLRSSAARFDRTE